MEELGIGEPPQGTQEKGSGTDCGATLPMAHAVVTACAMEECCGRLWFWRGVLVLGVQLYGEMLQGSSTRFSSTYSFYYCSRSGWSSPVVANRRWAEGLVGGGNPDRETYQRQGLDDIVEELDS